MRRVQFPLNPDGSFQYPDLMIYFSNVELDQKQQKVYADYSGGLTTIVAASVTTSPYTSPTPEGLSQPIESAPIDAIADMIKKMIDSGEIDIGSPEVLQQLVENTIQSGDFAIDLSKVSSDDIAAAVNSAISQNLISTVTPTQMTEAVQSAIDGGKITSAVQDALDGGELTVKASSIPAGELATAVNSAIQQNLISTVTPAQMNTAIQNVIDDGTVTNAVQEALDGGELTIKATSIPAAEMATAVQASLNSGAVTIKASNIPAAEMATAIQAAFNQGLVDSSVSRNEQAFSNTKDVTVTHNKGKHPVAVDCIDSGGRLIEGDITFLSLNAFSIHFDVPVSGKILYSF
jgi:hypothetical protein